MYTIGIDEVGRGPVAGPVVVCACAVKSTIDLLPLFPKGVLKDSKKLSENNRLNIVSSLEKYIESNEVIIGLGEVSAEVIDAIGIAPAIKKATASALKNVHDKDVSLDTFIFLDGSLSAELQYAQETIIKGDEKIIEIALASIIAKVHRDTLMKKLASDYPEYGFENHVGYGTKYHLDAIRKHGITSLHRKTFLRSILDKM